MRHRRGHPRRAERRRHGARDRGDAPRDVRPPRAFRVRSELHREATLPDLDVPLRRTLERRARGAGNACAGSARGGARGDDARGPRRRGLVPVSPDATRFLARQAGTGGRRFLRTRRTVHRANVGRDRALCRRRAARIARRTGGDRGDARRVRSGAGRARRRRGGTGSPRRAAGGTARRGPGRADPAGVGRRRGARRRIRRTLPRRARGRRGRGCVRRTRARIRGVARAHGPGRGGGGPAGHGGSRERIRRGGARARAGGSRRLRRARPRGRRRG